MSTSIVFHDAPPPSTHGRPSVWESDHIPALKARPGKWVNATEVWGVKGTNGTHLKRKYGLNAVSRTVMVDGRKVNQLWLSYPKAARKPTAKASA